MKNTLFLFVGPRAIGGTYWMHYLANIYSSPFEIVKSTTTRMPRFPCDDGEMNYRFISETQFINEKIREEFLETDEYCGHFYGTRIQDVRTVLKTHYGIMKITSPGAVAIKQRLVDVPVRIIFLEPSDDGVLKKNYKRRYGDDFSSQEKAKLLASAHEYIRTMHVLIPRPDHRIILSGSLDDYDQFKTCFRNEHILLN